MAINTPPPIVGNAAIVLRSRLKVRVLKENWEKKARVDEKGIILTNGDIESSRKPVQYQVTPPPLITTLIFKPFLLCRVMPRVIDVPPLVD